MSDTELLMQAVHARENSYCPYSRFAVGAALLTAEGRVYTGCNIENAAYTPTNCAERTAFFKAVSSGERNFTAIAVVGGSRDSAAMRFCSPCGVCRQVMMEFCVPDTFRIIMGAEKENGGFEIQIRTLQDMLPESFGSGNLEI